MAAWFFSTTACAQLADDNVVTAAKNAFGTVVGNQSIGLYNENNVRGFSPVQAGNLRIDGMYYDQQTSGSDPYLFSRSDIKVGIAAQSFPFPSPTGIVDLSLRVPGDKPRTSIRFIRGPLQVESAEVDGQYPLLKHTVSLGYVVAVAHDFDYRYAVHSNQRAASLFLRVQPTAHSGLVSFIGFRHNAERGELPIVYANGASPPPLFDEQDLPHQAWTPFRWDDLTAGVLGHFDMGAGWSLQAGFFDSKHTQYRSFYDLIEDPSPDGTGEHILDVTPGHVSTSYSGEVRLTKIDTHGSHQREITFTVRGRHIRRGFGGDAVVPLGPINLFQASVALPEPSLDFSASSLDTVHQTGFGINDIERWKNHASLSVGLMVTHYARSVANPGLPTSTQQTTKVLPTVSLAVRPLPRITLYASYTRGLEDAAIAPSNAVNRGEPPPAMPTWQADGGAQFAVSKNLKLLLGVFEIHKTYFAVNPAELYTAVGDISSRGIEGSLNWTRPEAGLKVIAGIVWLHPEVTRQAGGTEAAKSVPVGPVPGTIDINVDYAPSAWHGWGMSLQWKWLASRVATIDNRYRLPPLATLEVGIRYEAKILGHPYSVRFDIDNLTNAHGLHMYADYSVVPQLSRNYSLTVAADF